MKKTFQTDPKKFKTITVQIEQLTVDDAHNPTNDKDEDQLEFYQSEMLHFGYIDKPIVVKHESLWSGTMQEYTVLTQLQEVESAKALGITELEVIEIDDNNFTPDDAFRFSMHRGYFLTLSLYNRYYNLKKLFAYLKKNPEWANNIKTKDGKTRSKVALISGFSGGSISRVIAIGDKDPESLRKIDNGETSQSALYRKFYPNNPSHIQSDGFEIPTHVPKSRPARPLRSRRGGRSRLEGYAEEYEKYARPMPIDEIKLSLSIIKNENESQDFTEYREAGIKKNTLYKAEIVLNGVRLEGYQTQTKDVGNGFTEIKLISDVEPLEISFLAPDMREYFTSKGFNPESSHNSSQQPRLKLDLPRNIRQDEQRDFSDDINMRQVAAVALQKLGITKTKAELAVGKVFNESETNLSELVKKAIQVV